METVERRVDALTQARLLILWDQQRHGQRTMLRSGVKGVVQLVGVDRLVGHDEELFAVHTPLLFGWWKERLATVLPALDLRNAEPCRGV